MKLVKSVMLVALALFLPMISVLAAGNAIARTPDFYSYEFTKAQISAEIEGEISDQDLGEFFSSFMTGETERFQYSSWKPEWERELFTEEEENCMTEVRQILNGFAGLLAGLFILSAIACVVLVRTGEKNRLRFAFKISAGIFFALWAVLAPLMLQVSLPVALGEDSLLSLMINARFLRESVIAAAAASAVAMLLLASLLWRISKPKRMFW